MHETMGYAAAIGDQRAEVLSYHWEKGTLKIILERLYIELEFVCQHL